MLWSAYTGAKMSLASAITNWIWTSLKELVPAAKLPIYAGNIFWKVKAIVDAITIGKHPSWSQFAGILWDVANTIMSFFPGLYWWKVVTVVWNLIYTL